MRKKVGDSLRFLVGQCTQVTELRKMILQMHDILHFMLKNVQEAITMIIHHVNQVTLKSITVVMAVDWLQSTLVGLFITPFLVEAVRTTLNKQTNKLKGNVGPGFTKKTVGCFGGQHMSGLFVMLVMLRNGIKDIILMSKLFAFTIDDHITSNIARVVASYFLVSPP
jgi:hypothetical protein